MSDEVDVANDHAQRMIDVAINNAHNKVNKPSNVTGKCLWCEKDLHDDRLRRWLVLLRDQRAFHSSRGACAPALRPAACPSEPRRDLQRDDP